MSHWSNRYVGTPYHEFGHTFEGVHCWGLAVLVYAEELGIALPTYSGCYVSLEEQAQIAALVNGERSDPVWREVAGARTFDLVTFRRGRLETHIGIVVSPGLMLHVTADDQAKIEHYNTGRWQHRLTGTYRHAATMEAA